MELTRASVGFAVRAGRDAAKLSLSELSELSGLTVSSLSRTECGRRDLGVTELAKISNALRISPARLISLAETYERGGVGVKRKEMDDLTCILNDLHRATIGAAIEARAEFGFQE